MDGTGRYRMITLIAVSASEAVRDLLGRVEARVEALSVVHVDAPAEAATCLATADVSLAVFCGAHALEDASDPAMNGVPQRPTTRILITPDGTADASLPHEILPIPESAIDSLEFVIPIMVEREQSITEARALQTTIETIEACRALEGCLEPGKLYRLALDAFLLVLECEQGLTVFEQTGGPRGTGIAVRGFPDARIDRICELVLVEKALETVVIDRIQCFESGPVHDLLRAAGCEEVDAVLGIPVSGASGESGVFWILGPKRRFDPTGLERAGTVASYAAAGLVTAEQYMQAKERAFVDDVTEVYNARYLLQTADNEIQRAARYGSPLSVLFLSTLR